METSNLNTTTLILQTRFSSFMKHFDGWLDFVVLLLAVNRCFKHYIFLCNLSMFYLPNKSKLVNKCFVYF